jgi:hypothetical protein
MIMLAKIRVTEKCDACHYYSYGYSDNKVVITISIIASVVACPRTTIRKKWTMSNTRYWYNKLSQNFEESMLIIVTADFYITRS